MAETRKVLLSFDDGPDPTDALDRILATLAANHIRAEFFVLGSEVAHTPAGAAQIAAKGHKLQNHSWSHENLAKAPEETVAKELGDTQRIIKEKTGTTPTKVRPPYGAGGWPPHDPELARVAGQLGLTIENWDIDTRDWEKPKGLGADKLEGIKRQLAEPSKRGKSILKVLMHVQKETASDLQGLIDLLKNSGLGFATP